MKALILAAGYGTRLYPLTRNIPKPLLSIARRPVIGHIIERLEEIGDIDEILIVTNQRFVRFFGDWLTNFDSKKPIKIINDRTVSEKSRLGAIGDMDFVIKTEGLDDDLLVVGGDNLFRFNLSRFVKFAKSKGLSCCVGLYQVENRESVKKYSVVELGEDGKIISFQEKPRLPRSTLIAVCIYYFPKKKLLLIPRYLKEGNNPDAPGYYISWLCKTDRVYGFTFRGSWYDIGDLASYGQAKKELAGQ